MDPSGKEGFLSRAKWIFSSLSGIILRASRLSSPMQIPKECPLNQYCIEPAAGLKTLIYSQGELLQIPSHPSFIISSHMRSSSSPSSSPSTSPSSTTTSSLFRSLSSTSSSWSSVMDDLIGTESGVLYMKSDHEEKMLGVVDKPVAPSNRKRNQRYAMKTKEYPPPIPLLARKGILLGHIPWVLTRHYTEGKLVLKEDRMKYRQYFEAFRENGRLILNIVQLDDNSITCCDTISEKNEELDLKDLEFIKEEQEIEEEKLDEYQETEAEDDNVAYDQITYKGSIMILASLSRMPKTCLEDEDEGYGALRKCFTYSGRKISDQNFLRNAKTKEHRGTYAVQQAGSAPLALPVGRMTTVM